jgi:glucokinase
MWRFPWVTEKGENTMRKWVGIDVGGTTIKGAAVFEDGSIAYKTERDTLAERGTDAVLDAMAQLARDVVTEAGWKWEEVSGVGIGVPAFIDFATGVVERAVNLGWYDVPLHDEMKKRLGELPIALENDANAAALGEAWAGGGKGYRDVLCITLGTGVGGGVVIDRKIVHGSNGMAGEIGHLTIDPNGRPCTCGRLGCLETISSATGIVAAAKARVEAGHPTTLRELEVLTTQRVFEHAASGDQVAQEVLEYAIDRLGFALSNMCITINPECVVVGGGVSKAGEALLLPLRQAFARYTLPRVERGTTIRLAELGNDAGVIGAALLHVGQ